MTDTQNKTRPSNTNQQIEDQSTNHTHPGHYYEIHIKGHLNSTWSDWLEGLEMKLSDNGETTLSGPIVDQAALMGVLNKLNRLNLTIISIFEAKKEIEK
jgi:hypothetical protein